LAGNQVVSPKQKTRDPEAEQLQAVLRVRLKQLIERFPGRQTELAEKAGLKQSNISETFNHMPTLAKAVKICRAGGVTLDWLVGGDGAIAVHEEKSVDKGNNLSRALRGKKSVDNDDNLSRVLRSDLNSEGINAILLLHLVFIATEQEFWKELTRKGQAEGVMDAYQILLSERASGNKLPSKAKIIRILKEIKETKERKQRKGSATG
jgi:transcriptional regulator with XRE-family HTH domain